MQLVSDPTPLANTQASKILVASYWQLVRDVVDTNSSRCQSGMLNLASYLSIYLFIYLSIYLSIYPPFYLSICVNASIHLPMYP